MITTSLRDIAEESVSHHPDIKKNELVLTYFGLRV